MSAASEAGRNAAGIALFDLDYTLLGGDATYEWTRFLIGLGVLDEAVQGRQLDQYYDDYAKGTLDIHAFLHFDFGTLARHPRARLEQWREQYIAKAIVPIILPKARELIRSHESRGHRTVIVTAANSFITTPIAELLGVSQLLASDPESRDGEFTGGIEGIPCFHEGKVARLDAWLAGHGRKLADFAESYFYGDSQSDVPLMEKVSHPVAVSPDDRLAGLARERGWPVISLR